MKIFLTIFICFFFSFSVFSGENFLQKCYQNFKLSSSPVKYQFPENAKWENPYASELFTFVYKPLVFSKEQSLPVQEAQLFVSRIEELLSYIENSPKPFVKNRLEVMNSRWSSAVQAVPSIISFINSGKAKDHESLDVKTILKLTFSTFGHHTQAYLSHPQSDKLDWARMNLILKSISDFSDKPSVFSLYKIQRAVVGKYSSKEYIYCK